MSSSVPSSLNKRRSGSNAAFGGGSRIERGAGRLGWILLTIAIAIFLTGLHLGLTHPYRLTTFDQLIHFEAVEPFQHRVLLPLLVMAIKSVAPIQTVLAFGMLEVGFWIALLHLACRALGQLQVAGQPLDRRLLALTLIVPIVLQLMIPNLVLQFSVDNGALGVQKMQAQDLFYYVYDLPAAVFTLALVLLLLELEQRPHSRLLWAAYLLLFATATVNRETTLFILPFAALVFWRIAARRSLPTLWLIGTNAALFIVIQASLQWAFSANVNPSPSASMGESGIPYEHHLLENLMLIFLHPMYLLMFLVRFCGGTYIAVLLWRHYIDRRLAQVLICCALPLFIVAMAAGRLSEHRIFIELVPLVWLTAMQVIVARRSTEIATAPTVVRLSTPNDSASHS